MDFLLRQRLSVTVEKGLQNIHFKTKDMRVKINDKIYRLKEIESGVDSLMELVEEPQYKDGDFVYEDGRIMIFKSYPNNYHCIYLPRIGKPFFDDRYGIDFTAKSFRRATEEEKQQLLDALAEEGKRWNEEKKCIEDIPKRKFKKGDKVRIKKGISSKTHQHISPGFIVQMDDLIGEELTVDRYANGMVYTEESYYFHEEWLEPYVEELKKGDLAIFWQFDKTQAVVRLFENEQGGLFQIPTYVDNTGHWWANAIKFESKEQYERFIKGEI